MNNGLNLSNVYRFVEMMAPVFSRESWRCAWHMIQVCDFMHKYSFPFSLLLQQICS